MKAILAAGVLISALSTPSFAQCTDADTKKLEEFDRAWSEATRLGDRAALQGFVADNFTNITPTGLSGKAELVDNAVTAAERPRPRPDRPPRWSTTTTSSGARPPRQPSLTGTR